MKFSIILCIFSLILCSAIDFSIFNEFIQDVMRMKDDIDAVFSLFQEGFETYEKIKNSEEKKEYGIMLKETLDKLFEYYKENKKDYEKLKNLLKFFKKYGIDKSNGIINGYYHYYKVIDNILKLKLDKANTEFFQIYKVIQFFQLNPQMVVDTKISAKLGIEYKDLISLFHKYGINMEKIKSMNLEKINLTNKLTFLKFLRVGGNIFATATKTYDKLNKCKNRNTNAYLISSAQASANVGTNFAFGSLGSFLGSFIPIPVVGSFVGGIVGSYMGEWINSLYDFDC